MEVLTQDQVVSLLWTSGKGTGGSDRMTMSKSGTPLVRRSRKTGK